MLNKREKEVYGQLLDNEDVVLRELKRQYELALREIVTRIRLLQSDELTQSRIYQIDYQKALKKQIEAILEKLHADEYDSIHKYLSSTYTDAYVGTMYAVHGQGVPVITPIDQNAAVKAIITDSKLKDTLYDSLGYDMAKLKKHVREEITRGIATSLPFAQIARNISNRTSLPLYNAKRIVRTEGHRIQQASADDARKMAISKGANVVKQWDASLDMATRPIHRQLDGQIREDDEPFEAGGYQVMYPGTFGIASQDCNCRCVALTRARAALDEKELETLKERAEFFGLDKTKDFNDFKEKYLNAGKELASANAAKNEKNTLAQAILTDANGRFVNKKDLLYKNAANIKPIKGYEDFTCHADADNFLIYMDDGSTYTMPPEEYAERIRNSSTYKGGNIRIISCQSGAKEDGAAQKLADALGVNVYAPTEIANVSDTGNIFLSDNDSLADLWYNNGEEKSGFKETGEWKVFKPRKR